GASLPAFRVGGGLVLLLMALAMLNAKVGEMRQTRAEAAELESGEVSGVVPLAVPLLAGPGAISTTIIAAQTGGIAHLLALLVCALDARMGEDVEALLLHRAHHGARDILGAKAAGGDRFLQHLLARERLFRFGSRFQPRRSIALGIGDAGGHIRRAEHR